MKQYEKFIQDHEEDCKNFEIAVNECRLYGIDKQTTASRHYVDIIETVIDKEGFHPYWMSYFCANVAGYKLDKNHRIIANGGQLDIVLQIVENVCRRLNNNGYHCEVKRIYKYNIQ